MKRLLIPFLVSVASILLVFIVFGGLEDRFVALLEEFKNQPTQYFVISFLILSSDILLPVPSSVVMFTNGFVMGKLVGFFLSFVSVVTGSVIGYYLGKLASLGFPFKIDLKANNFLLRYGSVIILISRGIPVLSESISIAAGFNSVSFPRYLGLNLVGYFPICLLYAAFGSWGADRNIFLLSFISSLIISAIFWWFGRFFLSGQNEN